jgi:hypothetical protein
MLGRKPEEKRLLGRSRYGWEDNIKTDIKSGCGLNSFGLGQGPVAGSCEHGID